MDGAVVLRRRLHGVEEDDGPSQKGEDSAYLGLMKRAWRWPLVCFGSPWLTGWMRGAKRTATSTNRASAHRTSDWCLA